MFKIIFPFIGLVTGILLGIMVPWEIPALFSKYMALIALAAISTTLGGLNAGLKGHFDTLEFFSGFFVNSIFVIGLTFMGEKLGVDIYIAAVAAFGIKIFNYLSKIRRKLMDIRK